MLRRIKPPSPKWRTFLQNHAPEIAAIDFFTVPTATFRILFCFVVVSHDRRKILHVNATDHPNAFWAATQITEAFPWNTAPRFLWRDRDGIYGRYFSNRVRNMGIEEVLCATRSAVCITAMNVARSFSLALAVTRPSRRSVSRSGRSRLEFPFLPARPVRIRSNRRSSPVTDPKRGH